MHTGKGEEGRGAPQANFKRLVHINAIKPKIGDTPGSFVRKALTP
jgi:hypothetical protein